MKNILLFAFCCCVLSCKPTTTPPQNVSESKVNSTMVDTMSNIDKNGENLVSTPKITCDVQAEVIEKFEKPGVLMERLRFKNSSNEYKECLKILLPNQPCKIIDISYNSHLFYKLEDWDKDSFYDILEIYARAGLSSFQVYWFDKTKKDFINVDKVLTGSCETFNTGECEVFDKSKSLFIRNNNTGPCADSNFGETYTLFSFKKGVFRSFATINFSISGGKPTEEFFLSVKKYKSAKDEEGTYITTAFFNKLIPKVETLYKQGVLEQETYEHKLTTQMSDEQQDSLRNQYDEKIQLLHKEWTAMARPMVIQYWKNNLGKIIK